MNSPPPSYVQQHPGLNSQPAQHALSIRTATPSTSQRGPPSSPAQPHPAYPISIPPSKFAKAVRLYTLFRYEEGLAQRHGPAHADPLLSPATAQSVTSHSSRVYTPSVSTSAYDGLTDRSSLVSFTEEESAPLGQGNGSTELIAYNGTRIKHRVRKPLSPTAKAKAALIRCLGSCTSCRNRRVPCPLDHHDIDALEKGRQTRSQKQRHHASQQPSRSSVSAASHNATESESVRVISSGGALGQSNSLRGLGQNEELLQTFSTSTSDPQSLAGDPLAGIQAQGTAPLLEGMTDGVEFSRFLAVDPYSSYQDGQMLALGVLRDYYVCQHLGGLCEQCFETAAELEEHFETAHFEFNRLNPSYRYICSKCHGWSSALAASCQQCHAEGLMEVWIYGNFIRTPFFQRFPPDGHDPFKMEISSLVPFLSSYEAPGTESPFGPGSGDAPGFNGGMNHGGYDYYGQNTYQAPNSPGHGFDVRGPPPSGSYNNHGSRFAAFQVEARSNQVGMSYWYSKAVHIYQRFKLILVPILLLVSLTAFVGIHQGLIMKLQSFQPRPILPAIGFVGVLASFVAGYAFWSAKDLGVQRNGVHSLPCRPRRCPLHDLPTLSLDCKPARPPIYVYITGG